MWLIKVYLVDRIVSCDITSVYASLSLKLIIEKCARSDTTDTKIFYDVEKFDDKNQRADWYKSITAGWGEDLISAKHIIMIDAFGVCNKNYSVQYLNSAQYLQGYFHNIFYEAHSCSFIIGIDTCFGHGANS